MATQDDVGALTACFKVAALFGLNFAPAIGPVVVVLIMVPDIGITSAYIQ